MTWYEMIPFVSISILDPSFSPFLFFFSLCFSLSLFSFHLRRFFFSEKERDILVHIIWQGKKVVCYFWEPQTVALGINMIGYLPYAIYDYSPSVPCGITCIVLL